MFRLLGFDVRVRPGFLIFMVLIVGLHGNEFGLWLAGSLAVFTLMHEFGHAVAARHNGAEAEISLDFLAGYTSFVPHAAVVEATAGADLVRRPGVQIASSVAVLAAMGVNPLDGDSYNRSDAAAAIWWAGPVIGLLNLIPVLPLDGGHIAQTGLEVVFGISRPAGDDHRQPRHHGCVARCWCFVDEATRGFAIFIAFLLFAQFQMLGATSVSRPRRSIAAAADAERSAWLTGRSGMMLPGQELSPWFRAHRALKAGRPDEARSMLDRRHHVAANRIAGGHPTPPRRSSSSRSFSCSRARSRSATRYSEYVLADVLLRTGDTNAAGHYAAASFSRNRSPASAIAVARAAAAMGDHAHRDQLVARGRRGLTVGPGA